LNKIFQIKDLDYLRYFISFEVARSKKGIMMIQRKYILELLTDARLLACKPAVTLMDNLVKLSSTRNMSFIDVHAYRRLIERLMYLTKEYLLQAGSHQYLFPRLRRFQKI